MMDMGLVQRSIYGGILILIIIAVRVLLLDKLPKRTFPVLWGIALLRLLVPFSVASVFSVYTLLGLGRQEAAPEREAYVVSGEMEAVDLPPEKGSGQPPVRGQETAVAEAGNQMEILPVLWCAGALICSLFFVRSYVRSLDRFRKAAPVESEQVLQWMERHRKGRPVSVRQAEGISTPLTYGCLRPVILLPEKALEEKGRELEYILEHEYVHICYCDALMKLVMVAALCVHWFNPLVWAMALLLNRDIEFACDAGVLKRFGEQARGGYAMALIGMEEKKIGLVPFFNGLGRNAIEERINLIMKYRKPKYTAVAAAVSLVAAVAVGFATSAEHVRATENPWQESAGYGEEARDGRGSGDGLTTADAGAGGMNAAGAEADGVTAGGTYGAGEGGLNAAGAEAGSVAAGGVTANGVTAADGADSAAAGAETNDVILGDTTGDSQGERPSSALPSNIPENPAAQGHTLLYTQEGMPQEEPANLYRGAGYCLLVPAQGWVSGGQDTWMWQENEAVRFWVTDWSGNTWEQAAARLEEEGYARTEEEGAFRKESDGSLFFAKLHRSGIRIMSIHYTYPAEAEYREGFGVSLAAVAKHFVLLSEEGGEALSEDGKQQRQLAGAFWDAYLTGDEEALRQYLAEGYSGTVETFPEGSDGHVAREAEAKSVKGMDTEERKLGDKCVVWVEFYPAADADSLEYLEIELIKEEDGWKASAYGLER